MVENILDLKPTPRNLQKSSISLTKQNPQYHNIQKYTNKFPQLTIYQYQRLPHFQLHFFYMRIFRAHSYIIFEPIYMDLNSALQHFTQLVSQFTTHKQFDVQGNKEFKIKEKQLLQFTKSLGSLIICLMALETSNDQSTLYFASQFIKDKLKYEFDQLTPQVIQQTHQKITHLITTKTFTKLINNNLALSLSYLYIHCYNQLGSVIQFFKKTFSTQSNISPTIYYQYFFRYLQGIPVQASSKKLVIDQMKRDDLMANLQAQQTQIVMALHNNYAEITANANIKLSASDIESLLTAFTQWICLGQPAKQIMQQIFNHSVFKLAMSSLSQIQLSQTASVTLMSSIQAIQSPEDAPNFYEYLSASLPHLFKNIGDKIKEQQNQEAQNFIKVIVQFGIRSGKKLVQICDQTTIIFVENMIRYTENQMLNVFGYLIDFWETFINFIHQRSNRSPMTAQIANQIISKIYTTMCSRISFSPMQIIQMDHISQKSLGKTNQLLEDTRTRRQQSRYIFQVISTYFTPDSYITQVLTAIKSIPRQHTNYWGHLQAHIFSLRDSIKDCTQPTRDICQLVLLFQSITAKHVVIVKSVMRVYYALASMSQKNQEFVLRILNHIVTALDQPLLEDKASQTFQKVCQENSGILIKHIQSLYYLLTKYPKNDSILVGITHILKQYPDMLSLHLPEIIKNTTQRLMSAKNKKQKRYEFNRLFTIIQSIPKGETKGVGNVVEELLKSMWPMLEQILKQPENPEEDQDRLIERAVKFLKLVMRSIPDEFIKYLKSIFDVIVPSYQKYPINSYIYFFQVTFTVYNKTANPQLHTYIQTLYQQYCQITYQHLQTQDAIINHQHVVDDFIGMNKRIITFNTRMFLQSGQVKPILQFSILHCLGSSIPRVASSASQLFQIVFMIYWSAYSRDQYENQGKGEVVRVQQKNGQLYAELKNFILPSVPALLKRMFSFLESGPVESARKNILDCFQAVALAFPAQSKSLWTEPLRELGQDILTTTQKQRILQNLQKMGSDTHLQFLNSQLIVNKLLFTISNRFLYRQSRVKNL